MSAYKDSVISEDLFKSGKDDIIYEGPIFKFKPGLTNNFIERYVQISQRAFRYYRNIFDAKGGNKPLVAFRRSLIQQTKSIKVNKKSYLKRGSMVSHYRTEDVLFDNMFELILNEDYERNYRYRDMEFKMSQASDRDVYRQSSHSFLRSQRSTPQKSSGRKMRRY